MNARSKFLIEWAVATTLGVASFLLPVVLNPDTPRYDAAFLPIVRTSVERVNLYTFELLLASGVLLGWIFRTRIWLLGFMTIAFLPAWSFLDVLMGGDHNLLPLEWIAYAFYGLVAAVGVAVGRGIRTFLRV